MNEIAGSQGNGLIIDARETAIIIQRFFFLVVSFKGEAKNPGEFENLACFDSKGEESSALEDLRLYAIMQRLFYRLFAKLLASYQFEGAKPPTEFGIQILLTLNQLETVKIPDSPLRHSPFRKPDWACRMTMFYCRPVFG